MYDGAAVATAAHAAPTAAAKALIPVVPAPVEVQAANPALDNGLTEVAFVDTSVAGWETLVTGIQSSRPGMEIDLIDGTEGGLAQMADWAATHSGYDFIDVLSYGAEAEIDIGTDVVSDASLQTSVEQTELNEIGQALKPGGDLLVYGCDVAEGSDGLQFITDLAADTHAVVAASTDATGAADLGETGRWRRAPALSQRPLWISIATRI